MYSSMNSKRKVILMLSKNCTTFSLTVLVASSDRNVSTIRNQVCGYNSAVGLM